MTATRFLLLFLLVSCAAAWSTFTVPHTEGQDDTPALAAALATGNFSTNATILFAKGTKYNIFTPLKFPTFTNVEVRIEGNFSYPSDMATVQSECHACRFDNDLTDRVRNAELVGASVSHARYVAVRADRNIRHLELSRGVVSALTPMHARDLSDTRVPPRFTFTGGTNVTLRGSTDDDWGWVDGHGQAVRLTELVTYLVSITDTP